MGKLLLVVPHNLSIGLRHENGRMSMVSFRCIGVAQPKQ